MVLPDGGGVELLADPKKLGRLPPRLSTIFGCDSAACWAASICWFVGCAGAEDAGAAAGVGEADAAGAGAGVDEGAAAGADDGAGLLLELLLVPCGITRPEECCDQPAGIDPPPPDDPPEGVLPPPELTGAAGVLPPPELTGAAGALPGNGLPPTSVPANAAMVCRSCTLRRSLAPVLLMTDCAIAGLTVPRPRTSLPSASCTVFPFSSSTGAP